MELLKFVLQLDFTEAFNPFLELREIARIIAGKPKAELQGPPLIVDDAERKQRIEVHVRSLVLQQEMVTSLDDAKATALARFDEINTATKIPTIAKCISECILLEPYPLPFHEILMRVKKRFLLPSEMANAATDVALSFDQVANGITKHDQFGPMQREQLQRQFLLWPRGEVPENFLFIRAGYRVEGQMGYSSGALRQFLTDASEWQMQHAAALVAHMQTQEDSD